MRVGCWFGTYAVEPQCPKSQITHILMSDLELIYLCGWTLQNLNASVHNNSQWVPFLSYPGWAIANMYNVPVANGSTRIAQVVHDLLAVSHSTQLVETTLQQAWLIHCGLVSCVNGVQIVWKSVWFSQMCLTYMCYLIGHFYGRETFCAKQMCVVWGTVQPSVHGQSWHPQIRSSPFSQLGQGFLNVNFILHM